MRLLVFCLIVAGTIAQAPTPTPSATHSQEREPVPLGEVKLIPFFFPGMKTPAFLLTFRNTSKETTDYMKVYDQQSIRVDGTLYPRGLRRWAGSNPLIRPGEESRHTLSVSDFLFFEPGTSGKLRLTPGRHTLSVTVGRTTSDEIVFHWDPRE